MKILKNPSKSNIVDYNVGGNLYTLMAGKTDAFKNDVANYLMEIYDFLEEVPVTEDTVKGKTEYKCSVCDYKSTTKIAVLGHARKHGSEAGKPIEIVLENEITIQKGRKAPNRTIKIKQGIQEQNFVPGVLKSNTPSKPVDDGDTYGPGLEEE